MAASNQTVFYPPESNSAGFNPNQRPMCKKCNTYNPHSVPGCADRDNDTQPCSAYCNTRGSNNVCSSSQAYCAIGRQYLVSHGNIPMHPAIPCVAKDQIIAKSWTAAYWNSLTDILATGDLLGHQVSNPDTPNVYVAPQQVITASIYNAMVAKYNNFGGGLATVAKDQVIYGANHAATLTGRYGSLTFNGNVCDICNASAQGSGVCNCNCACPCNCPCQCSCPCSCSNPCSCDCSCDCSCSCDCNCSCSSS